MLYYISLCFYHYCIHINLNQKKARQIFSIPMFIMENDWQKNILLINGMVYIYIFIQPTMKKTFEGQTSLCSLISKCLLMSKTTSSNVYMYMMRWGKESKPVGEFKSPDNLLTNRAKHQFMEPGFCPSLDQWMKLQATLPLPLDDSLKGKVGMRMKDEIAEARGQFFNDLQADDVVAMLKAMRHKKAAIFVHWDGEKSIV